METFSEFYARRTLYSGLPLTGSEYVTAGYPPGYDYTAIIRYRFSDNLWLWYFRSPDQRERFLNTLRPFLASILVGGKDDSHPVPTPDPTGMAPVERGDTEATSNQ